MVYVLPCYAVQLTHRYKPEQDRYKPNDDAGFCGGIRSGNARPCIGL
jgi:hypothetical protein